jgi:hypothetical protein
MEGGLPLPGLSFVSGVLVEFPSLPVSAFAIGGAKKLFVATGCGFW